MKFMLRFFAIALGYFALARLGISLTSIAHSALIWPASGFSAFVVWRYGRVYALPIVLVSFILRLPNTGFGFAILIAAGRGVEALAEGFLLTQIMKMEDRYGEMREVIAIFAAALVAGLATFLARSAGIFAIHPEAWSQVAQEGASRWVSGTLGFFLFFPLFHALNNRFRPTDNLKPKGFAVASSIAILVAAAAGVGMLSIFLIHSLGISAFLCFAFPIVILVAGVFPALAACAALIALSMTTISMTYMTGSDIASNIVVGNALNIQIFLCALSIAVLVLQGFIRMGGRRGPLKVMLAGAALGAAVMWFFSLNEIKREHEHSQNLISIMSDEIVDRARNYVNALGSTAAFWETYHSQAGDIPGTVWKDYTDRLRLPERFPGLRAIGLIQRVKRSDLNAYIVRQRKWSPEYQVRPVPSGSLITNTGDLYLLAAAFSKGTHASSYGLDYASEKSRKDAADYAAMNRVPKLSERIELASTYSSGNEKQHAEGFTLMFPLFENLASVGWVIAAYSFKDFFTGAVRSSRDEVAWTVAYGSEPERIVYRSGPEEQFHDFPMLAQTSVSLANTDMVFRWYKMPGFASSLDSSILWLLIVIVSTSIAATATMTNLDMLKTRAVGIAEQISHDLEKHRIAIFHSSKMSSLGHMAAGIAHEINNPLTVIIGLVHQIETDLERAPALDSELKARQAQRLERINSTVSRIAAIIRGLQSFSRSGASTPKKPTPVSEVIETVLDLCKQNFVNNNIEIRLAPLPTVEVSVVAVQIEQVLMNLLINSFDAIQNLTDKWIEIGFELSPDWLAIIVTDSGPGLPAEVASRIMEPFFTTKPVGKGTGLGLSICRGILESHGGNLVYVKQASNTRFRIELPLRAQSSISAEPLTKPSRFSILSGYKPKV